MESAMTTTRPLRCMFLMLLVLTSSVTPWAKDTTIYHTGTIVNIDSSYDPEGTSSHYTLTIQDGTDRYVGDRVLHIWNHEPDDLKVGGQVQYRIDGHHLFVKRANGKELKTKLCAVKGGATLC